VTSSDKDLLLFDLGGVLIEYTGFRDMPALLSEALTEAEVRERSVAQTFWPDFECGRLTPQEFGDLFAAHWPLSVTAEEFMREFSTWTRGLLPGAAETLKELRPRFRLAALSNTNALHWPNVLESLAESGMERVLASHELGLRKPDPAIYERALEELDVAAERVTFFDDLGVNVEAARGAGMKAYCVEGVPALRACLRELGYLE
jgi:putative hydrolase of the HAD superfamily